MNDLSSGFGAMPTGFSAVSMDEMNQIEGGFWKELGGFLEKVAVAVVSAIIVKKI